MICRYFIYMSLFLTLTACGLSPSTIPEEHFYRLGDTVKIKPAAIKFEYLQLADVKASGIYNERAILYRDSDKPLEIHRYHYHFWMQSPAKLVQSYMQQYLQQSGVTKNIATGSVSRSSAGVIQTEIIRFERLVAKQQAEVDVRLRIGFAGASRIYTAQVKADSTDMYATIEAFNQALSQIMLRFQEELSRANKS